MILQSAIAAFSMYSKIPMPQTAWNEKASRFLLCWFPAVGLVVGVAACIVMRFLAWLGAGPVLTGALLTAVPLLLTGGIHLDGFLDSVDARASFASREKKLEILKDPHIGAFAVIFGGLYLLVSAGAWSTITWRTMQIMLLVFPLERALSAVLALQLPDARSGGSLAQLKESAQGKTVTMVLLVQAVVLVFCMFILDWKMAAAALCTMAVTAVYYRHMTLREFGGVTGDLAGWFLQSSELAVLLTLVIASCII